MMTGYTVPRREKQGRNDEAATAFRTIAQREAYFPWDKGAVQDARRHLARKHVGKDDGR